MSSQKSNKGAIQLSSDKEKEDVETKDKEELADDILEEASDDLPEDRMVKPAPKRTFQGDENMNPDGSFKKGAKTGGQKPVPVKGFKHAKQIINDIMEDEPNQQVFRQALQRRFEEDPIDFFLTFSKFFEKQLDKADSKQKPLQVQFVNKVNTNSPEEDIEVKVIDNEPR